MQPKTLGIIGEAKVLSRFVELDVPISVPFGDNASYDLVAEINGNLKKIQVKTSSSSINGAVLFRLAKQRNSTTKSYTNFYTTEEVDYYALYSTVRDKVYLIPFGDCGSTSVTIRYEPPKNNQQGASLYEKDYEIGVFLTAQPRK